MTNWRALQDTVCRSLDSDRIGAPVAANVIALTLQHDREFKWCFVAIVQSLTAWFGQDLVAMRAHGDIKTGPMSVLCRFRHGQSATVLLGMTGKSGSIVEFELWGNRGSMTCSGASVTTLPADDFVPQRIEDVSGWWSGVLFSLSSRRTVFKVGASEWNAANANEEVLVEPPYSVFHRGKRRPLSAPFGVLLVGGERSHQAMYGAAFQNDSRASVIGVCAADTANETSQSLAKQLADRLQVRYLPSVSEAMVRPDVHVVSASGEPERRTAVIEQAALAGRHLYLDKPLCPTKEEAQRIVSAVRGADVLAHMFTSIQSATARQAQTLLDSDCLGELRCAHYCLTFAKGFPDLDAVPSRREAGSDAAIIEHPHAKRELTNIGVYAICQLSSLLRRKAKRVTALTGNYFFSHHVAQQMEDFGQMLIEWDGGLSTTISVGRTGWSSHPAAGLNRLTQLARETV